MITVINMEWLFTRCCLFKVLSNEQTDIIDSIIILIINYINNQRLVYYKRADLENVL